MSSVIVWDIETVPDIKGFAAANRHDGRGDDEIRAAMGDKFPKHIYHSIICIGALVAHQENGRWTVDALGAPHTGERSEKELISSFIDRIAKLSPQLVTSMDRRLIFLFCDIAQWSMEFARTISTGTSRMRSISAMSCPHSAPKEASLHEQCRE